MINIDEQRQGINEKFEFMRKQLKKDVPRDELLKVLGSVQQDVLALVEFVEVESRKQDVFNCG